MMTARFLRLFAAGMWVGLRAALMYLLVWPVWLLVTAVVWFGSIFFGAFFALLTILCPSDKLQQQLVKHNPYWFKYD